MTLAYNQAGTVRGIKETNNTYVVATGNDTTTPVTGPAIDNRDGRLTRVTFGQIITASTGTSPTLQTTLQGSTDGTNWFTVLDSSGSAVQTTSQSISSATSQFIDTNSKGITRFPPFVRTSSAVGGSSSPGWTGSIVYDLDRDYEKKRA